MKLAQFLRTSRRVDFTGLAVCALITVIGWFAGASPLLHKNQARAKAEYDLTTHQFEASRREALVLEARIGLTRATEEYNKNRVHLASARSVNRLLARIGSLARRGGVRIDQIRPEEPVDAKDYSTVEIHLAGRGRYASCRSLMQQLNAHLKDCVIESFVLTSDGIGPSPTTNMMLHLVWYAQSPAVANAVSDVDR